MKHTVQDTFLEKYAGHIKRTQPPDKYAGLRAAYAKAGIDPKKAARRWS